MPTPTTLATTASDSRQAINDMVRDSARAAIDEPAREQTERMRILGLLLDPQLAPIDRAIHSYEQGNPFSTTERERIAAYVTRAIEKKLIGTAAGASDDLMDLGSLATQNPVAWVHQFARACIKHGVTEVRRDRQRSAFTPVAHVTGALFTPAVDSAEEAFLLREHADVVETVADVVETWGDRALPKHEQAREVGDALRLLRGVPELHIRNLRERRWVAELVETEDGQQQILESLLAFRDLASGDPKWEQMDVDDRLLDLWIDFDAEQADSLASGGMNILVAIVRGAVTFPPKPQEAQRVAVRRIAKGMSSATGWSSLVMELERAWVGAHFAARPARDNTSRRTDEEAESERKRDAEGWPEAAQRALEFPGRPLGAGVRTPEDVDIWLGEALKLAVHR